MVTKQHIMDMYVHLRKTNSSIPDEALEFMKDVCLEKLEPCVYEAFSSEEEMEELLDPHLDNAIASIEYALEIAEEIKNQKVSEQTKQYIRSKIREL